MRYDITITDEAERQFRELSVREQRVVEAAILSRLVAQPDVATKAIKRLRPNPLAEFELRVGDIRILYNLEIEAREVVILIVGRKVGNKLIVGSEEFHGHEADPSE